MQNKRKLFQRYRLCFVSFFLQLIRVSVVVGPLLDSVHESVSGALRPFHLPVTDQLVQRLDPACLDAFSDQLLSGSQLRGGRSIVWNSE